MQPDTGDTGTGTLAVVPEEEGAERGATVTKGEREARRFEKGKSISCVVVFDGTVVADSAVTGLQEQCSSQIH